MSRRIDPAAAHLVCTLQTCHQKGDNNIACWYREAVPYSWLCNRYRFGLWKSQCAHYWVATSGMKECVHFYLNTHIYCNLVNWMLLYAMWKSTALHILLFVSRDFVSVRQIAVKDGCYYSASQATITSLKPEQPGKVRYSTATALVFVFWMYLFTYCPILLGLKMDHVVMWWYQLIQEGPNWYG